MSRFQRKIKNFRKNKEVYYKKIAIIDNMHERLKMEVVNIKRCKYGGFTRIGRARK